MDTAPRRQSVRSAVPELGLYRIAAWAGLAAGALGLLANAVHPRFSDPGDTVALLDRISTYGSWRLVHLVIVVSIALGVVALVGVTRSIAAPGPAAWARLGLTAAVVTGTLMAAAFAIDGFGFAGVAERWAGAGAERAELLRQAETLGYVEGGLAAVAVLGLFGFAQSAYALALWGSAEYPRWTGAAAAAGGVVGLVSGLWAWTSGGLTAGNTTLFTITAALFAAWIVGASLEMLRMRDDAPERA
ncbi:MAG TPA: hypothetical protein VHJ34_07805 [Actinomycetota bacterium]|nr:hypothetical protein [Actinomycetota bacterium]